jgi:acylphosphatase
MVCSAARFIIRGRVQGVGYRWWAERQARRLGLRGWVRNRSDGSVELLAIGAPEAIERLAGLCRQGPPAALGTDVESLDAEDDGSADFDARPTL